METPKPGFRAALAYWVRLGWVNFGGPAGQIALLHRDLVERRRWVDEPRFLHALNFCMLLPGPEAKQLAIYLGWLLHGTAGALAAGLGFVLPSVLLLWALAWLYAAHGEVPAVAAALAGIQPVVVAIVLEAVVRIGRRAFRHPLHAVFAAAAFLALLLLSAPFPAIVGAAAVAGAVCVRFAAPFAPAGPNVDGEGPAAAVAASGRHRPWRPLAAGAALWAAGLALVALARPAVPVLADLYGFFTRAAFVTFGGAYAVLAYVAQVAVGRFGWLSPEAMLDGLALAETTPGPLIIVLEFVGFQAGWNHPGAWSPLAAATAGAAATAWVTFLPSFVFILVGAPYVDRLRGRRWLAGALAGVTAAVVGVILHLGFVFGRQVLLDGARLDATATALAAAALVALVRFEVRVPWLVAAGATAGLLGLALSS
jgi:chromate transporter